MPRLTSLENNGEMSHGKFPRAAPSRPPWTRAQRATFRVIMSHNTLWEHEGYQVRRMDLTTAPGGDSAKLPQHFNTLIRHIGKSLYYPGVQHVKVQTDEGNGVLHTFLAWRGSRTFWIDQRWLSKAWEKIHGAPIVHIQALHGARAIRVQSAYVASQYVARQSGKVRLSYSQNTFGFPLRATWLAYRVSYRGFLGKVGYALWNDFLRGKTVPLPDGTYWNREHVKVHGPPVVDSCRSWCTRNDGGIVKPMYAPVTQFVIGNHVWQTRGPMFRWELAEGGIS